jgi:Fur family transcriptional regulator, ferric uptake regulator
VKEVQPIDSTLRKAGLRVTPVRVGVIDILRKAAAPLDVPQILAKLPPYTDAVTVYRTLNTFTRKRMVHRIRGEDRSWRYALGDVTDQRHEHRHPHFVCESCGKVECLKDAEIPKTLIRSLKLDQSYAVSYPEVVLHGVCPRCK